MGYSFDTKNSGSRFDEPYQSVLDELAEESGTDFEDVEIVDVDLEEEF